MKKEPKDFDYSQKGYLFYKEYLGLAAYLKKRPLGISRIGNEISYEDCKFKEEIPISEEEFNLISDNSEFIDTLSLFKLCDKLGLEIKNIKELVEFISEDGKISHKKIKKIFE